MTKENREIKAALIGNPNSGKTSLFNGLTGLNQKVGNFPGVTVDRKSGSFTVGNRRVGLVDLPGTYSLQPRSMDEEVAANVINLKTNQDHPELVLIVSDATHLKTSLYLTLQVLEKGIPTILVMNMSDQLERISPDLDIKVLEELLGVPVVKTNARTGFGLADLNKCIAEHSLKPPIISWEVGGQERHITIRQILQKARAVSPVKVDRISKRIDDYLTHPVFGGLFFVGLLALIFQSIYAWSTHPMDLIDSIFAVAGGWFHSVLPDHFLTRLWIEGVWAGLGGVIIFIPQIALLFLFISILEETGYMARVSFLSDQWLRRFGLQGRSVVPLISGVACAVPAVLAARTIPSRKERLLTIMITPLMSCSARLPVYALLIALVIPTGFQGITLLVLYMLGFVAALAVSYILNKSLPNGEQSHFVMELPDYRLPKLSNVVYEISRKVSQFVTSAGKIIVVVSILLWLGASFGPGDRFDQIEKKYDTTVTAETEQLKQAELLENSYIGILGKTIEPVIKPLGYDWKIGIALITSFAAREVFVGTMATIYSVGAADGDVLPIKDRMQLQKKPDTGEPLYDLPFGLSLLVFYAFAMQCMSTLAVVKTETGSWKWPIIQFLIMTGMAYICSLSVYQIVSLL